MPFAAGVKMPAPSTLELFSPFLTKKRKNHVAIQVVRKGDFAKWIKAQGKYVQSYAMECGFEGKTGQFLMLRDQEGDTQSIIMGAGNTPDTLITYAEGSQLCDFIKRRFSKAMMAQTSFYIDDENLDVEESNRLHIGWGWAMYEFARYKQDGKSEKPALILSKKINKERVQVFVESTSYIRDLINTPANDMGPDELEAATLAFTALHGLDLKVIRDKDLLKKNFPMIYAVGKGSSRRPRLLDFTWGDKANPHVTLVGKGVCFDTGGLDIKPSAFMFTMKKDMGGSAHVLGLAHMIITLGLPIYLRVLIPAVENSISGDAFRPADILDSRKGLTVEVGDTDAEGRLVLADALTYACEEDPELVIDFATLTGAARVALGEDLPVLFATNENMAEKIRKLSAQTHVSDPVWNLPLWPGYRKDLESNIADLSSTGKGKAGAINAALFMQAFVKDSIDWVHMDVFAWEQNGRPGRPRGGADTGMRAIFAYLEDRYAAGAKKTKTKKAKS
jgi:leucyl aminopeptidase